ncbi:MAG: DUF4251 domain-containing protein [Tannerella sp.]|jgi:archaellum component FlaF (FlaF/FlaG flagellin family)|nr:DUF4251 domain-containing protein [Tannerella sp.]
MKTIQFIFVSLVIFIGTWFVSCSSSNVATKNEQAQIVKEKIDNKHYTIDVDRMLPMNGQSRQLTSSYSLTIKGDTVKSYLPYFGQAYNVPYGGGQGLIFDAPITVYTLSFDNKGTANITFQTRSEDDSYRFNVQIFNNGSSTIQVTPNNRQSISYYGDMDVTAEKP